MAATLVASSGAHASVDAFVRAEAIGKDVRDVRGASTCTTLAHAACPQARESSEPAGFSYLSGVALDGNPTSPRTGDVYVADLGNRRIQELSAAHTFLAMFGWDVNVTRTAMPKATQAEKNLCTAAEVQEAHVRCGAGRAGGTGAESLEEPTSVAVDPRSGDLFVEDGALGNRIAKYTGAGRFVWTLGRHVNSTTGTNLCSASEMRLRNVGCGPATPADPLRREHGAFRFAGLAGDLLAIGGPEGLLYIGDEHRVQEFTLSGRWVREISLLPLSAETHSAVAAIAVDATGDVFVVYHPSDANSANERSSDIVREIAPSGRRIVTFSVQPWQAGATVKLQGLALDGRGELVTIGLEQGASGILRRVGALFSVRTGRSIGEFPLTADNDGSVAFDERGDMYMAATDEQELLVYRRMQVADLFSSPVPCDLLHETPAARRYDCAFAGEQNPYVSS